MRQITLQTMMDFWKANPKEFANLPEFDFAGHLAAAIARKGCTCGMGGDIANATQRFNEIVSNLSEEQILRFKKVFVIDKLTFGIQTPTSFTTKVY